MALLASAAADASASRSAARDVTPSLGNARRRCVATVLSERKSRSAMSLLRSPPAASAAICCSRAVSGSASAATTRVLARPVARSSASARDAHGCAPSHWNRSSAAVSCARDSRVAPARRRRSPYRSWTRAYSNGHRSDSGTARASANRSFAALTSAVTSALQLVTSSRSRGEMPAMPAASMAATCAAASARLEVLTQDSTRTSAT